MEKGVKYLHVKGGLDTIALMSDTGGAANMKGAKATTANGSYQISMCLPCRSLSNFRENAECSSWPAGS
jgi:hypothetical protein